MTTLAWLECLLELLVVHPSQDTPWAMIRLSSGFSALPSSMGLHIPIVRRMDVLQTPIQRFLGRLPCVRPTVAIATSPLVASERSGTWPKTVQAHHSLISAHGNNPARIETHAQTRVCQDNMSELTIERMQNSASKLLRLDGYGPDKGSVCR